MSCVCHIVSLYFFHMYLRHSLQILIYKISKCRYIFYIRYFLYIYLRWARNFVGNTALGKNIEHPIFIIYLFIFVHILTVHTIPNECIRYCVNCTHVSTVTMNVLRVHVSYELLEAVIYLSTKWFQKPVSMCIYAHSIYVKIFETEVKC